MSLTTYKITLQTIGPVHIGSGVSLNNSDYIYNSINDIVYVVNGRKLVTFLNEREKLDRFLFSLKSTGRRFNLYHFLKNEVGEQSAWNDFIQYSMPIHKGKGSQLNTINPFIRDSMNRPYLPGSSLKGALRTILVGEKDDLKTNQMFRKIKVSDSATLQNKKFVIYQKTDVNKIEKTLPLFRECIDNNQTIEIVLTIENNIVSIEQLKRKIAQFYKNYYEKWLMGFQTTEGGKAYFDQGSVPDVVTESDDKQVIFLGGGVGFANKTIYYQKFDKEIAKQKSFDQLKRRFRHVYGKFKATPKNVPIALKTANNKETNELYLQGACYISFKKI